MACMNDRGFVRAVVMEGMIAVAILGIIAAIVVPAIVTTKTALFMKRPGRTPTGHTKRHRPFSAPIRMPGRTWKWSPGTATGLLPMYVQRLPEPRTTLL